MAKRIGRRTVTVVRAPARVDRLSDDIVGPPSEHDIKGCVVMPRSSQEEGKGWVIVDGRMVVAPYGADVLASDRVRCDGVLWEVDGEPGDYEDRNARGKATMFYLKRQGS